MTADGEVVLISLFFFSVGALVLSGKPLHAQYSERIFH